MNKIFTSLHMNKQLLLQYGLIFVAFLIMVLIGSVFGARIVSKNVASYGEEFMNSAVETTKAYLDEYKLTLDDVAFSVEKIKNEGADIDEIQTSLASWTEWILDKNKEFESFLSIYSVVDDILIDGQYVKPPEGYIPQLRPWYIGALEKNGEIHYCNPYTDVRTGEVILTISKLLFDKNGVPFGVIAIDVFITNIADYVKNLQLMNSGYGILLDANRVIVIHPDESLIGTRLDDVSGGEGGYADISSQLAIGKKVSAFSYTTYAGVKSVAFFNELFNGWYVGIISPNKLYYSDVKTMIAILSAAGFILMTLLCIVLTFLHIEKYRSEEANKIKTSFLANMSHEIRTPMNAIIGMTDLLLNESLSSRQQGYVNDIKVSSHSLLSIINDILDLSKIESGKLELNPVDYDFRVFIDNIRSMFRFVAEKKGLEFKFETEGEVPACLFGDDIKLRQVLTNICGNAVKFTNKGFIRLKVTVTEETILFEMKDTGLGVRKEDIPKLFDPFTQADVQKNRKVVGTGLGLPISKTFVEMMGGKILVESEYGQGTVFTVTIPKIIGDENAISYESIGDKGKNFFAPSAKVLVVDDNEVNLKVASGLLNLYKIEAVTALSGMEAIRLVQETKFDIVFMDHMMPEMDGVEATKEIRKLGGKYKQLTIIALTANAVQGAKEMFIANGLDDLLTKPIEIDKLAEILRAWLPAEKIEEQTEAAEVNGNGERMEPISENESEDNETQVSFLNSLHKIKEINTEIGMNRVSGLEEMYRETLELFHKKLLAECEKMEGFLNNKDLHNLAISVHGMKSSLSTIGAMKLSETAYELEMASKNKESIYCEEHLPGFLSKLRSLHEQLLTLFPNKEIPVSRTKGNVELLRGNVQTALNAADDFDGDAGMEAIDILLEYDFSTEINKLLEDARNSLMDFDFDAAIECLNQIDNSI